MDDDRKKAMRLVWLLLGICLGIAVICAAIVAYLVITYRGRVEEGSNIIYASKILALVAVFFLVLAFGYLVPILVKAHKRNRRGE